MFNANGVVIILIAINAVIFYVTQSFSEVMYDTLGLFYPLNDTFQPWQFFTHMFMHGGFGHLLLNMFGLLMFGSLLERVWGKWRFLVFFLLSGLGAALFYQVTNYIQFDTNYQQLLSAGLTVEEVKSMLQKGMYPPTVLSEEQAGDLISIYNSPMVGASGALYGLLVAFAMLFPNHKLFLLFLPVPIPAKFFIPVLIAIDVGLGFFGTSLFGLNVAHFAHVGGAITGFLLMIFWKTRPPKIIPSK
ncbi:MAG: GlpG protein (membrane protein of glp regulon) [uncultured Thiotrichaceae bacterium]|uniref:GlpG protein (Membrane protein of glp regulon) n=1 Tax=uncultured Thiotrichaceae bacterium TaxID=298394 RepID=A0A6S6SRL3_9GAMM|nr:MAG: GlpG protein (membrane protein of glp regulon) [uncultured Thiotrichaceae bacterium]